MDGFAEFLAGLFRDGSVSLSEPPGRAGGTSTEAAEVLRAAYETDALDLAGPPLPFDPALAAEAGRVVRLTCWALVSREDRGDDLARRLTLGRSPVTAVDHASADLLLRYLPKVYRRARAVDPSDALVGSLGELLRRWPLSGVLADLDEPPLSEPGFEHPGLMLRYAERLDANPRDAWRPESGPLREWVERVGAGGDRP